jgi:hypothetical protein
MSAMQRLLNSPDGELLVEELETIWNPFDLRGETDAETNYNVGLRDAYMFIKMLQDGELIHE